jgi:hypothetical protein
MSGVPLNGVFKSSEIRAVFSDGEPTRERIMSIGRDMMECCRQEVSGMLRDCARKDAHI